MNRYDIYQLLILMVAIPAVLALAIYDRDLFNYDTAPYCIVAAFWTGVLYRHFKYLRWIEATRHHNTIKEPDESRLY